jgi:putative membrane protein
MKQISYRILMVPAIVFLGGAMALAQQQPMGGASPQPSSPTNNNPNMPNSPGMNGIDQTQQQGPPENAMQDKAFVHDALEGGMAEVQLGKLAAQKGASDDVKQFGQKMVDDHTQLGDHMTQLAQQMGVKSPKGLSKKDEDLVAKLQNLSGTQFDDAYIKAMVKDHKNDISNFKAEAQNTQNPAVRQMALQGGQMIDQHLQIIQQIAKAHSIKS